MTLDDPIAQTKVKFQDPQQVSDSITNTKDFSSTYLWWNNIAHFPETFESMFVLQVFYTLCINYLVTLIKSDYLGNK